MVLKISWDWDLVYSRRGCQVWPDKWSWGGGASTVCEQCFAPPSPRPLSKLNVAPRLVYRECMLYLNQTVCNRSTSEKHFLYDGQCRHKFRKNIPVKCCKNISTIEVQYPCSADILAWHKGVLDCMDVDMDCDVPNSVHVSRCLPGPLHERTIPNQPISHCPLGRCTSETTWRMGTMCSVSWLVT